MFTHSLSDTLWRAAAFAGSDAINCTHLLAALIEDSAAQDALEACGVPTHELKARLSDVFENSSEPASELRFDHQAGSVLSDAQSNGMFCGFADGITVLLSLFAHRGRAYSLLQEFGICHTDIANYVGQYRQITVSPLTL